MEEYHINKSSWKIKLPDSLKFQEKTNSINLYIGFYIIQKYGFKSNNLNRNQLISNDIRETFSNKMPYKMSLRGAIPNRHVLKR